MTVHNYRSWQVNETLNEVNRSSVFRDMRSAKSGPNLWQIWQVFGPWASPYGANGQMSMTVHNYRPRKFHRTSNGENPSCSYRDMCSASLAAARPPDRPPASPPARLHRDDNTPPARRAEGLKWSLAKPQTGSCNITRYVDGTPMSEVTQSLYSTSTHPTMVAQGSRSWSWMINSHPFLSMSISAHTPIPQIKLFQTLTFKLQGQGHGCGQRARPHSQPSI